MKKRNLEKTIHSDLEADSDYAAYLALDTLLSAQHPLSRPAHHDEMLFVIQHQVAELWFKLVIHEVRAAMEMLRNDDLKPAAKIVARVKQIQNQLYNQWSVLDTLTPSEYAHFRGVFGKASGFQSPQYRLLEFLLGNKSRRMLKFFAQHAKWSSKLEAALEAPSLFDEFLAYLNRAGYALPAEALNRDFSQVRDEHAGVVAVLREIYEQPRQHWVEYEMCEALMDVGNNFQFWRFHHMKTVERIIGHKAGSGGSSGVSFLKQALDIEFFPELIQVRTELADAP